MTLLTGSEHEAAKSTTTVYHPMSSQRVFGMFFAIFGSPLGSPKPPKIDFFLKKKNVPGNAILSTFAANCVHLDFLDDFSSILDEI